MGEPGQLVRCSLPAQVVDPQVTEQRRGVDLGVSADSWHEIAPASSRPTRCEWNTFNRSAACCVLGST
ncbi:hypothetical protein [Lentzea terrae]|uniref:hypothetical protein n=1 Tax=Lentzea terrae TaxID=2200761 RepID=UPI000DD41EB8|nr:hypothetical protein [Lentzea terrae]